MAVNFRPLTKADFPLFAGWLAKPHVQKWWREPATTQHVAAEYGACTDGDLTTRVYVVQDGTTPIGIMQVFKLASYPEWDELFAVPGAVSIDYFLGEEAYLGRGYGTRMIREFIDTVARPLYPDATAVATSAELENVASLKALAKAGFEPEGIITGEYGTPERVMVLRLTKSTTSA